MVSGVPISATVPNFVQMGQTVKTVADIFQFNGFQNSCRRHLRFVKFKFLAVDSLGKFILRHRAKFHRD